MSIEMAATRGLLRLAGALRGVFPRRGGRRETARPTRSSKREASVTCEDVGGHPVVTVTPRQGSGVEIVYLHGGAYTQPLHRAHWWIVRSLVRSTGATVTVPLYGLAPGYSVDDAYPFLESVLVGVRGRAGEGAVVLAGDSAGGALATGLAIRARDAGLPAAAGVVLISPWVDATLTNPEIDARVERRDPMLDRGRLERSRDQWAGGTDAADPLISPLHDRLGALPPLLVLQGDRDLFAPDALRFVRKARAAGTPVELRYVRGAIHVYPLAAWTPEARRSLRRAAAWITERAIAAASVHR